MHHLIIRVGALVYVRGHRTPHRLLQGAAAGNSLENTIFGTTYIFRPPCIRSINEAKVKKRKKVEQTDPNKKFVIVADIRRTRIDIEPTIVVTSD